MYNNNFIKGYYSAEYLKSILFGGVWGGRVFCFCFFRGRRDRDRMIVGFYNYLCNRCLSLLKLWVRFLLRRGVLDTTFCDKVCQWLAAGRWFSPSTPVSSTNKTDRHDINIILLKVALNTIILTTMPPQCF